MREFTWGIIGPGWIATEFSNDLKLAKRATHKVVAVLGRTMESALAFAEKQGVEHSFDNIQEFVKTKMDAVYIATPHPMHYHETIACLEHRIPVLCEKPISVNGLQLKEMVETARQYQTFLMEGMWIRFLPSITYTLSVLREGKLGAVQSIKSNLNYLEEKDPNNRFFNPELGGGSLLDLGSYNVYLAHLLLGKPNNISAKAELTNKSIDKNCLFQLEYAGDKKAVGFSTFMEDGENIAEIVCDNGTIRIGDAWNERVKEIVVTYNDGTTQKHIPQWDGHGFQFEAEEVFQSILKGKLEHDELPLQCSIDMMETMDEIRRQTGIKYPYDSNPEAIPKHK